MAVGEEGRRASHRCADDHGSEEEVFEQFQQAVGAARRLAFLGILGSGGPVPSDVVPRERHEGLAEGDDAEKEEDLLGDEESGRGCLAARLERPYDIGGDSDQEDDAGSNEDR